VVHDVSSWLRSLGLGQHIDAFVANEIGPDLLPTLTDADLRELGVMALGQRKRLLQAIARLTREPSAPTAGARAPERRRLTVMFVDLVGSTALSQRLDPEEMQALLRAFHDRVGGEIARHGGHVAKLMGDGLLAYFGWPVAREETVEQAARAGLATVAQVAGMRAPDGVPLGGRVGIATGLVVVGELMGEGAAREATIAGETPNLAARLQAAAAPGTVVIAEATRRLLGQGFAVEPLGKLALRGLPTPVPAFRLVAERLGLSRFDARRAEPAAPIVGRDEELALLLRRWSQAAAGRGQAVLVVGEAGIGKSRLAAALIDVTGAASRRLLRYQCSPQHGDSPLWPVIQQLVTDAKLLEAADDAARIARLDALLRRATAEPGGALPLLAELVGVPVPGPPLHLTAKQRRARSLAALVDQVVGRDSDEPALVLFEDVHWIDPSTLELIGRLLEAIDHSRTLLVLTCRPEGERMLAGRQQVTRITLNRLSLAAAEAIVARVVGDRKLAAATRAEILTHTDGVPLFIEELTKTVIEVSAETPTVPASLHDSLLSRLDRVPEARLVAQTAACIGREFESGLLAAVMEEAEPWLAAGLDALVQAELLLRHDVPPGGRYSFKHALLRDAAYASLLRAQRQQVHARIAKVWMERFPGMVDDQPELLAHHLTEAGRLSEAISYWLKAGQHALQRSAMQEAVTQLGRALDLLWALPDGPERQRRELDLQLARGPALIAAQGFAAPETARAYARACELALAVDHGSALFPALYGQWVIHFNRDLIPAHETAMTLLRMARERRDAAVEVTGHRAVGSTLFKLGRLMEGRRQLEAGLALYDPARDRNSCFIYAIDSRVVCASWLAYALLALGLAEQARSRADEGLRYARELAHPNTTAYALGCHCGLHQLLRDREQALSEAEEAISLAKDQGFPYWLAVGKVIRGWALGEGGRATEGIEQTREGVAELSAVGSVTVLPYFMGLSAEAHGKGGRPTEALGLVSEALTWLEKTGESWFLAELHRLRGDLLRALPDADDVEAEASYRRAIGAARDQGARMWEVRAATALARHWVDRGERREALDLLAPAYATFTEGRELPDLLEAKAVLEGLS
jgi:class 3 adenylate cyclase/predicted ATPase